MAPNLKSVVPENIHTTPYGRSSEILRGRGSEAKISEGRGCKPFFQRVV